MKGEKKDGFKARLNEKLRALGLPIVPLIHCIIHRENLCAKVIKMDHVINVVIKVVNFLRKQGLNHRSFRKLLKSLDSEFDDIPYHTAVRWLSKEKVFTRFVQLKGPIKTFTKSHKMFPELEDDKWWQDLSFLKDLFTHLSSLNVQLQGANHTIVDLRDKVKAFQKKLELFQIQIQNGILESFKTLQSCTSRTRNASEVLSGPSEDTEHSDCSDREAESDDSNETESEGACTASIIVSSPVSQENLDRYLKIVQDLAKAFQTEFSNLKDFEEVFRVSLKFFK